MSASPPKGVRAMYAAMRAPRAKTSFASAGVDVIEAQVCNNFVAAWALRETSPAASAPAGPRSARTRCHAASKSSDSEDDVLSNASRIAPHQLDETSPSSTFERTARRVGKAPDSGSSRNFAPWTTWSNASSAASPRWKSLRIA